MRRQNIPGVLDYRALANLHRPQSRAALAAAIREMHQRGLLPRDIAMHLRMDLGDMIDLLRERRR
jgi:hypothetical protein